MTYNTITGWDIWLLYDLPHAGCQDFTELAAIENVASAQKGPSLRRALSRLVISGLVERSLKFYRLTESGVKLVGRPFDDALGAYDMLDDSYGF